MKKAMLFAVLFLTVIIYFGSANASMMMQKTIDYCLELEDTETISSCIMVAYPIILSDCDKIPQEMENYDELLLVCYQKYAKAEDDSSACSKLQLEQESIDDCYAYGFFCEKISDSGRKAECEQSKFNAGIMNLLGGIVTMTILLLYFGIPIAILLFIIKTIIDALRKGKSAKKPIKRNIKIIVALAIIWFVLAVTFCFPPVCYITY